MFLSHVLTYFFPVVKSPLAVVLALLYCCHPPPLLHSPADVRRGCLVVPAVYLLPFRGFTWEATAQINSLNSRYSVGTSLSFPCSLAHSISACPSPSDSSILSLHLLSCFAHFFLCFCLPDLVSFCLWLHVSLFKLMQQHFSLTPEQSPSTMGNCGAGKLRQGSAELLKPSVT